MIMNNFGKVIVSLVTAVVAAAIAYAIKKMLEVNSMVIPQSAVKHKDELTLEDLVMYFKQLSLDKALDTPFVSKDLLKYGVELPEPPKNGENVLLVGVFEEQRNVLKHYLLVYSKKYDEALQNVLAKAKDGIITLS